MTHDELLARIDEPNPIVAYATQLMTEVAKQKENYLVSAFEKIGINPQVVIEQDALIKQLKSQLRTVVELHKPTPDGLGCSREYIDCHSRSGLMCEDDCNTYVKYPCATIKAIQGEMK